MNRIVVFYNPFLPELKISINGKRLSPYSALTSCRRQRLERWCDTLFPELYREVNSDYEVLCVSNEFACGWLGDLAQNDPHCLDFSTRPLPFGENAYERLETLERLGYDGDAARVLIPVVNASGDERMTGAVYEILEEQGVFERAAGDGLTWTGCPLADIALRTFIPCGAAPGEAPFVIALCAGEEDSIRIDSDAPVYALVMGTETRFIRRRGGALLFSVEPDGIGKLVLDLLEEEALSPLVSRLAGDFPPEELALLTEAEQEELALVRQASPVCQAVLPRVLDIGRPQELKVRVFPPDSEAGLRIVSDQTDVLDVRDGVLHPLAPGEAELSVFLAEDPYPAVSELVRVRRRRLITAITLSPSPLYLPLGGSGQLEAAFSPADAENGDEILWESSDGEAACVEPVSGRITARGCGHCFITARTPDVSCRVYLEVQPPLEDIRFPCGFLELFAGERKECRYQVSPERAYGAGALRVFSSDGNIAEYRGGCVWGKNAGECKIVVKNESGSISRELRVTVRKKRGLW